MKNSKKQICLLSLLVSSNLFASDYTTNNLTVTNKYILEALYQNGKNKTSKKDVNSTTSSGDPIYNLFYLSRAIATNTNSLEALGYLNYLAQNSKSNSEIINSFREIIIKDDIKEEVKVKLLEEIKTNQKTNQISISVKIGGSIEFTKEELKDINGFNSAIKEFRSIDIVGYLNSYYSDNKDYLNYQEPINKFNKIAVENISNFTNDSVVSFVKSAKLDAIYLAIKNVDNKIKSKKGNNTNENFIILTDEGFKKLNDLKGTFFQECLKNEKFSLNDYVIFLNEYNIFYQKLKEKRDSLIDDMVAKKVKDYINRVTNIHNSYLLKYDNVKEYSSKINETRTIIQETNNEISGFKVPSQSDLINSVAQFMANRAKQETMIWFVQYLQNEIQNPLLWDAFPETKEMLETFDLERIKDLNENWRTSLSSDFVKMPTNLINSQWLANQALEHGRKYELEVIQSSVKSVTYFQKLVNERNNYRSILKHFYEQSNNSELFKNQKNLKDIITLLYIVSNEFYTIQDKKMYYVTSEQLNNISDEQWKYFLDLVEIKYGSEDKNVFNQILGDKFDDNDRKKLVNLISDFSQIHALSKAAMDENHPSFNLAWNKMIDLLKYVDPNYDSINNIFNSETYPEINQLQSLYKIGQQIAKKDFKAATKGTLEFIKPLYTNLNFNIEVENNKLLISNMLNQESIEILNVDKFKKTDIQLKDFSLSFDKKHPNPIKIKGENEYCFSINDLKNEIKSAKICLDNNEFQSLDLSEYTFLNEIFKPIEVEGKKLKNEEINKQISNSLLLANLIVDLADNPLKVINNNNYEIFDIELEDIQDNLQNKSVNKLIKTSMLFTDIFNARDEKGVYNAIEDMFSPKESYMIKRKHKRSFTVNGYVGLYGGYQFVQSQPSDYTNSFAYGITAPIGLTYSGKEFGLFLQFIELGNVVNHYLWSNADYSHKQKLSVKEFFSPGLKVLYNINKTPFVAFAGTSFVQVDKHYNERMEIVNNSVFDLIQVTAGVKIDIPFYTICKSNKSKKKKF